MLAVLTVLPALLTGRLVRIDLCKNAIKHTQAVLFYKVHFFTRDMMRFEEFF